MMTRKYDILSRAEESPTSCCTNLFLLLQKRPRDSIDLHPSDQLSRSQSSPLVGAHLEATTFRPPQQQFSRLISTSQHDIAQRRIDDSGVTQGEQFDLGVKIPSPTQQNFYNVQQVPKLQRIPQQTPQPIPQQTFLQQQQIPHYFPQISHGQDQHTFQQRQLSPQIQRQQILPLDAFLRPIQATDVQQQLFIQNIYRPVPYVPINAVNRARQYQENLAYNQFLQNRRFIEEQQIRDQLNKPHNRFEITGINHGWDEKCNAFPLYLPLSSLTPNISSFICNKMVRKKYQVFNVVFFNINLSVNAQ